MEESTALKPGDLWGCFLNVDGSEATPPFQILLHLVHRSSCPMQRLAKRLRVPLKYASVSKALAVAKAERREMVNRGQTESGRRKLAKLDRKIQALTKLEIFASRVAYTRAQGCTLDLLRKRNVNIFHALKGFRETAAQKGLEKRSDVWFYPNRLTTEEKITRYGDPYHIVRKSTAGRLLVDSLHFFFVDIDNANLQGGEAALIEKLRSLPLPPDVIVRSSKENKFHCYWSIEPVKPPLYEDEDGKQTCQVLFDYKKVQTLLVILFGGDPSKIPATSLLRVPGMKNCKPAKGRRPQIVRYYAGSRELPDARAYPRYRFEDICSWAFQCAEKLGIDLDNEVKCKVTPRDDESEGVSDEREDGEEAPSASEALPASAFDFDAGWESAIDKYLQHFSLTADYLDGNDRRVFQYIHRNRLHLKIVFSNEFRLSLRGRGDRYAELSQSIKRISLAGRSRRRKALIPLAERYRFSKNKDANAKNSYGLSDEFVAACGYDESNYRSAGSRDELLKRIMGGRYQSEKRNLGLQRDASWMARMGISAGEAEKILIDKVFASSKLPGGCAADISNVPDVIRRYFSET